MIISSRENSYEVISTIRSGKVNDCYIAVDSRDESAGRYTILLVRDHDAVKDLMEIFRLWKGREESPLVEAFTFGQDLCLVFPYRNDRELERFFVGEAYTLQRCETVCINLILSCISSYLPPALLYLIISQRRIHLSKDDSVYLSYDIDLAELDRTKTERDCATDCAKILLDILSSKSTEKNISYILLSKKVDNRSYSRFTEIYRDLMIVSTPTGKRSIITRIKSFFYRNMDRLFGILFWVCLILMIIALILLFSHLVLGDIPFLRIFFNSFKTIGTESLNK
ncbi:MAG: hypothetical protein K5668_10345 [Lachnospiraceae bacterium]|nr:hypothetical protein [Lachnospiraceae bacterium]